MTFAQRNLIFGTPLLHQASPTASFSPFSSPPRAARATLLRSGPGDLFQKKPGTAQVTEIHIDLMIIYKHI
jgi:hypothetical protein